MQMPVTRQGVHFMKVVGSLPSGIRLAGKHKRSRALLVDHEVLCAKVFGHEAHNGHACPGSIVRHCIAHMHVKTPWACGIMSHAQDLPHLASLNKGEDLDEVRDPWSSFV